MSMTLHFWNKLDIDLDVMANYGDDSMALTFRYEVMLSALRFFLNRTKEHPFSFQLHRRFRHLEGEEQYIDSILGMLVAQSMWWEDAFIRFRASQMSILYCAKNRLPLLRSVQLLGSISYGEIHQFHDLLDNTPRLTRVNLTHLSDWRVDWSRLLVLKVGVFDDHKHLLSVLCQTKQLEKLAIYSSLSKFDLDPKDAPLLLPWLRVLTLIDVGFLSALQAPSLEGLYINGWDDAETVDAAITSFLFRSSCQLKRFGMAGCVAASLHGILQQTPDLVHLSLDNDADMVKSFGELSFHRQRRGASLLAPHLQSLTVVDPGLFDLELMELSTLLASRANQVLDNSGHILIQKLQNLTVITLQQPTQYLKRAAVERLRQQCQTKGVSFDVKLATTMPWPRHDNTRIIDW